MSDLKVELIVEGTAIDITDGASYALLGWSGLGVSPLERLVVRGPLQDGVTDVGFRLGPRKIALRLDMIARDLTSHFERRNELAHLLKPREMPAVLRVSYPSGNVRQLDVHLSGGLSYSSTDMRGFDQQDVVEVLAPYPLWYDPTMYQTVWLIVGGAHLVFPATFPIQFLPSGVVEAKAVEYPGTWREYPTIILTGPMKVPKIENLTTGEKIELGYNIPAGETVIITLRSGEKTVRSGSGANLIGTVTDDSDLTSFHLAPHPEAPDGNNQIKLTAGDMTPGVSQMQFQWYARYIAL